MIIKTGLLAFVKKNKYPNYFHQIIELANKPKTIYVLGILVILPLIIISYFNNPTGDDFDYNLATRNHGYLNAQKSIYINWSGRYVATALMTIQEFVSFPFTLYKIIPVFIIISLILAISYTIQSFLPALNKTENFKITTYIFIIYIIIMPSISQAFYWLPGSMSYQTSNIFMLIFSSLFFNLLKTKSTKQLMGCVFLSGLIIGTNETSMLILNYLLFTTCFYQFLKHKKVSKHLIIILIGSILFSLVVVLAPGNAIRSANVAVKHNLFDSLWRTTLTSINYIIIWLPLIFLLVGLIYNTINQHISNIIYRVNPYYIFCVVFLIPFIGFFPAYWSLSHVAPARTINCIVFCYLLGCLFLAISILNRQTNKNIVLRKALQFSFFIIFLCTIASNNNIRTNYSNLISGDARAYDTELKQRYSYLLNTSKKECIVPALKHKPATIYFDDITTNKNDWRNKSYQKFFYKTSISLDKNLKPME